MVAWQIEMVERLKAAVNGEKKAIIDEYSALSGRSPSALYRIAEKHGYKTNRKPRTDKGKLKSDLSAEQINLVSSLIQTSAREVKGAIMPVEVALQLAEDSGYIDPGTISVSRLTEILRERSMNAAALKVPTPHINMRSLHPNHVHIFDASICIQYYLKNGKGLHIMDERDFYKNKPDAFAKIKQKLIRMVLADHFSHCIYVKYYLTKGENARMTFDFLCSAWRGIGNPQMPFRGVPKFLLMDAGAANVAKGILGLLERLNIEIPKSLPKNARRQGSAEVTQNIVERHFESRLRFEPSHSIEELNAWATDWMIWFNATKKHTRTRMPRTDCWSTIRAEQLRELPSDEILRDLYAEPEVPRTVSGDYKIEFRGEKYVIKHIPGLIPNRTKVNVILRPYHWPQIAVEHDGLVYLADPIRTIDDAGRFDANASIIGQEYKAQPETLTQQAVKVNENLAYGEERKKGDIPFGGSLQVFGHQADKLGNITRLPKRGTPMEVSRDSMPQNMSIGNFIKQLRDRTGSVTADLNKELRAVFGGAIDTRTAEQVILDIEAGRDWRPQAADGQQQAL